MASLPVYDMSGKEVGKYEIDPSDLAPSINKQLLHDVVVMYQANLRQGTKKTKSRAEVAGSTKKMYRQKGTGNARAGSRRSGIRRGGGHIFALRNRDFSYRLPKKAIRLATRMAIASKVESGSVVLVDGLSCDAPKTKVVASMLQGMGLQGQTTLIATDGHSPMVYKSARNIAGVTVSAASDMNALTILKPRKIVMCKSALESLKEKTVAETQAKAAAVAAS